MKTLTVTTNDPFAGLLAEPSLSFRGGLGHLPRSVFEPPARFRHHGDLLTTRDVRLATDNFTGTDVVAVLGNTGRDISPLSPDTADLEVLFQPDISFGVLAQERLEERLWLTVIVMEDDAPPHPLDVDETMRRIGTAIVRAHSLPPADIVDPLRYSGPLGVDADGRLDQVR